MSYQGDLNEGATLSFTWNTNDSNGAAITRSTDGTVSVYKNGDTTQSVAGVTDTEDFDGVTGVHLFVVDTSADAFYATGADYSVVLSAATIDTQTVNATIGTFSIKNRFVTAATSGTSAVSTVSKSSPDGFVITTGSNEANNEDSTHQLNAVVHSLEDDGGATDAYYIFDVGGNGVPTTVTWWGFLNSNGDDYTFHAWNWSTSAWEQVGSAAATNGSTVVAREFDLTTAHVGTGANIGLVHFRLLSADGTKFSTDRVLCSYAVVTQSVGYADGAIWVNTNDANTNTTAFVDGVADNPVSTWAAALTLSASTGLDRFHIVNGSTVTLSANSDNLTLIGNAWALALGGQSIAAMHVDGATVSGLSTGAAANFHDCDIGTCTIAPCNVIQSRLTSTTGGGFTMQAAGTYIFDRCSSGVAGNGAPDITWSGAGSSFANFRDYSGGLQFETMTANDTASIESKGQFIEGTCSGGAVTLRGNMTTSGVSNITLTDDARIDIDQVTVGVTASLVALHLDHMFAVAVADEIVDDSFAAKLVSTAGDWSTYVWSTDSLQAMRDRGDAAWITGAGGSPPTTLQNTTIATLASQTSFTLTAGSADDNAYVGQMAVIEDSATATQKAVGVISAYTGSTKTVALAADPAIFTMLAGDTIDIVANSAPSIADSAISATTFVAGAINAATIADGAIDAATFAAGAINAAAVADGAIDAATFAAGAINAAAVAAGAIDNATFAADVQSTAYATNILAQAAGNALVHHNLDHLLLTAVADGSDMTPEIADGTIFANLMTEAGDTSDFVRSTDSLEAIGAKAALITAGSVTISSGPNEDGTIVIFVDGSHTTALGNQIDFALDGTTYDLSTAVGSGKGVYMRLTKGANAVGTGASVVCFEGTVVDAGLSTQKIRFEFTAADTTDLDLDSANRVTYPKQTRYYGYSYQVVADTGTQEDTFFTGYASTRQLAQCP